uniref:Uncharacterized protein n=1 Tax=Romanomermis culicivorax TaxID=13658 RepID=A0A915K844_ROMCU
MEGPLKVILHLVSRLLVTLVVAYTTNRIASLNTIGQFRTNFLIIVDFEIQALVNLFVTATRQMTVKSAVVADLTCKQWSDDDNDEEDKISSDKSAQ